MARRNSYSGKYKLTKAEYLSAKYYALRYNDWYAEYHLKRDTVGSMAVDGMPHNANGGNPTEKLALRRTELKKRLEIIEESAKEASPELSRYLLKAVTNEDISYNNLKMFLNIPCGKTLYYDIRRRFYWILSKKI